ncbi:bifunctional phosphopantothenoylcysteine decarboxylase/phosphopantothenate--cysteine ligase CoaBC [Liquorilactobacillus vini]|uniref:Coenzyme A biosynthesis bifunctional protein CoaBC n=1 Tax=Liquorilactobacillus vini DSM 20605 TaxID=1133569 RepID=A0A0R2CDT1_9LACO|nr:bifunctional phosphopantothenoylcysteine decarboxylase/phosphopantothenate--cysteine ligase CoaBC [Liquorilactobacillus vini]KRM89234.1 phosphopantothenoylcysteine decarboxylase phosphopantothenate-cysteine ligase [Liquorilactobacillus vini DSM 20605]
MKKKKILICLAGGIALYKAAPVIRQLLKNDLAIKVAMTPTAEKFVSALTFATLIKQKIYRQQDWFESEKVLHVFLADWADEIIVIPATANLIAKMATGLADDLVSAILLAANCPKYIVPAMNEKMLLNAATQRNLAWLKKNGVNLMPTSRGLLAEGYAGRGRLPEPAAILAWLSDCQLAKQDLKGKKVLVSAGPTVEAIDPVRYLTNHSSGKMGYAIAEVAQERGAQVTLVSGPTKLSPPQGVALIPVTTALQMQAELENHYEAADYVIMAAAVADYRPVRAAQQKIKKGTDKINLPLVRNPDILFELGQKKRQQVLVGFAAETQQLLVNAQEKLFKKKLDLLVANDVARQDIGFGSNENEVYFLSPTSSPLHLAQTSKQQVAEKLFDLLLAMTKRK